MILAAGRGTRMQPLSLLRAKPALPVLGVPVIAHLLALLEHCGASEVIVNLYHLPDSVREAVERYSPPGLAVSFSPEAELLGTGGGIKAAADFLRESDPCLVLTGDMLLDADLAGLAARHRERGDRCTLMLLRDPRQESFGSIGVDAEGCVRRIGSRFDLGGERAAGLFVGVRVLASRIFETLPPADQFEDLSDWFAPLLTAGARDIRSEVLDPRSCSWEPVGTPAEYLRVNLNPPRLPFMDRVRLAEGTRVEKSLVIGTRARIGEGARLERAVIWDGESVPEGLRASDGVFAGGRFHDCRQGRGGQRAVTSSRGRGGTA